jgi:hypothetical protein
VKLLKKQQAGERQQHAERITTLRRSMAPITWVNKQAGEHRHKGGHGNRLPATGNAEILRHRRQQADRQKLDGNQAGRRMPRRKPPTSWGVKPLWSAVWSWAGYVLSWRHLKIKTCGKVAQFIIKSVTNLTFDNFCRF